MPVDIWRLAAGLGLFLFGMFQLERALTQLAGRPFKKFLRRHTENPLKGVASGVVATAALQSSSVVGLIVLALAGSGVIALSSALGIVFGANLGTTATGWIIATVGFKLDIEALSLPLIALGGLGVVWSSPTSRRAGLSYFLAGFGLMLLGLDFMKAGALSVSALFDPGMLAGYPLIVFLVAGLVFTAVIQSSSATIMITLSALYANVIELPAAAAIAIGADLGTTGTIFLGTLTGSAIKRQVAIGLLIFNIVADVLGFLLLTQLLFAVTTIAGIQDPLIGLVAFHSLINLLGILLFLPLTSPLSRLLERRVHAGRERLLRHLSGRQGQLPEVALDSLLNETRRLIDQASALNCRSIDLPVGSSFYAPGHDRDDVAVFDADSAFDTSYSELKRLEGEMLRFALRLQASQLDDGQSARLAVLLPAIRNAVHSAKSMKDARADLQSFRQSASDTVNAYYHVFRDDTADFYRELAKLRDATEALALELLTDLVRTVEGRHAAGHSRIYHDMSEGGLDEEQVSTLLNVNREIIQSNRAIVAAIAAVTLTADKASTLSSLP